MTKRVLSEEQKQAARDRAKAWRLANPDRVREIKAAWKERNRERVSKTNAARYQRCKEEIVAKQKIYNQANAEKLKAYHAEYEAKNKEKRKAWRIANRELKRLLENNRRLKIVGVLSKGIVKTLMEKQKGLCNGCQVDLMVTRYHVDHIVAVSKGGKNIDSNVQLLCVSCNTSKGAKDFDAWKKGAGR